MDKLNLIMIFIIAVYFQSMINNSKLHTLIQEIECGQISNIETP